MPNFSFYLEVSGGQNYNLYLNVVCFYNTSVNQTSFAAYDSCFPAWMSNMCSSIDETHSAMSQCHQQICAIHTGTSMK